MEVKWTHEEAWADVDACGVFVQESVYSGSSRRPFKLFTNSSSRAEEASYIDEYIKFR